MNTWERNLHTVWVTPHGLGKVGKVTWTITGMLRLGGRMSITPRQSGAWPI